MILAEHADATKAASLGLRNEILVPLRPMVVEVSQRHVERQVALQKSEGGVLSLIELISLGILMESRILDAVGCVGAE